MQFYAAAFVEGDGIISVFDTEDNLLTTITDLPLNIRFESGLDFTFFDLNAEALGAPGGIGRITYLNTPLIAPGADFGDSSIDDFGFPPIGAPGTDGGPPPATAPTRSTARAAEGSMTHHNPSEKPGRAVTRPLCPVTRKLRSICFP